MPRLAKIISDSRICSRRKAELLIKAGCVKVNGLIVTDFISITSQLDQIEVSGSLIEPAQPPRLWTYYKPAGLITTHQDTHNRPTIFASLTNLPKVISVGRLDLASEGLLLLTNNGALARAFELPSNKIVRIYRVRACGRVNLAQIQAASSGVMIAGIFYQPRSITLIKAGLTNSWFEVVLTEGKNREIRRIFSHFELVVNRLIRTMYGPFELSDLKSGQYHEQPLAAFQAFLC